jgi:hypothetical protein
MVSIFTNEIHIIVIWTSYSNSTSSTCPLIQTLGESKDKKKKKKRHDCTSGFGVVHELTIPVLTLRGGSPP